MKSYVDANYYNKTYKGELISGDSLEARLTEASHDIDSLTYNRIKRVGFDNLTPFQKDIIKKSVCAHADFNYQYGDFLDTPISGYSAGTTSVSIKEMNISGANGIVTSKRIYALLKQTGLTVRLI